MLEFQTIGYWEDHIWDCVGKIYHHAFDSKGAKQEKILRNMFKKGICILHIGWDNHEAVALAIMGRLKGESTVLIDYMAVRPNDQNKGIGRKLMKYIETWWKLEGVENIIIEVEAEKSHENLSRIAFWEKCGFTLTDYIHHYIWVPEPYQAMFLNLQSNNAAPANGKELFTYITQIHKYSFQGA